MKRSLELYCCYLRITYDITINLLDEDVRDQGTPWMAQRNSGRHAQGAWVGGG